ncbi:extracellular solute-binding protein [Candidatus Bathyarchaeota archaeon]|nr:extracellular solute-binding protein [Candidatus Bathyarchaeota archaeon]
MSGAGRYFWFTATLLVLVIAFGVYGFASESGDRREVVIYTSVDQVFSEPVFRQFEEETGIEVKAVYDVEAAKTTGLVNRLVAERARPLCDVWWNGEIAQTLLLKEEGVLTPCRSPSAEGIPAAYVDPEWCWTGFGGRARVLLVNMELVEPGQVPSSIYDLLEPEVPPEMIGIAYPVFGTTATQAAALYAELGPEEAYRFFVLLRDSGVRVVDGNSVVRDLVAEGQLAMGLTDTDDAIGAIERGAPVAMVFLDQGPDGMGTLLIPNTVAMISGGPNPEEAERLIDYLLSKETVAGLVESGWFQLPLRSLDVEQGYFDASAVKGMGVSYVDIYGFIEQAKGDMSEIFVR